MQAEIDELMRQRALERQALGKVEQLPEKAKRQSESTINMMKALQVCACGTTVLGAVVCKVEQLPERKPSANQRAPST